MREVGSRPRLLRQNEKKTVKNGLFGRSGGTRTHGLQYPKLARYHLRYASKIFDIVVLSVQHEYYSTVDIFCQFYFYKIKKFCSKADDIR